MSFSDGTGSMTEPRADTPLRELLTKWREAAWPALGKYPYGVKSDYAKARVDCANELEALLAAPALAASPVPPPAFEQEQIEIQAVVNGQPTTVTMLASSTVREMIEPALAQTGTISRPESEWEVRLMEGQPIQLDQPLAPFRDQRLWVNLRAGYAVAPTAALPPTEPGT